MSDTTHYSLRLATLDCICQREAAAKDDNGRNENFRACIGKAIDNDSSNNKALGNVPVQTRFAGVSTARFVKRK